MGVRRGEGGACGAGVLLTPAALGVRPAYYADTGEDAVDLMVALDPETGAIRLSKDEVRLDE